MPMPSSTDATLGTGSVIGKYFSIVSTIPSVALTGWLYLLLTSGALEHAPRLSSVQANATRPGYIVAGVMAAIATAVIIHPLQFSLVQLLEGYWGSSALGRGLRVRAVMRQLQQLRHAEQGRGQATKILARDEMRPPSGDLNEFVSPKGMAASSSRAEAVVRSQAFLEAWQVVESRYPRELSAVLPTRLGNVLRRHELLAGAAVHLPIIDWATHIGMVADPSHTKYVNDQRTQMDLAVRMTWSGLIGALLSFGLLWPYGYAVGLTLLPLAVAWLSYRGAVISADGYGRAMRAWVDLNRIALYERLGLAPVDTSDDEREQNDRLEDLSLGQDDFRVRLAPRATPAATPPSQP
jgi:hypothetical protein